MATFRKIIDYVSDGNNNWNQDPSNIDIKSQLRKTWDEMKQNDIGINKDIPTIIVPAAALETRPDLREEVREMNDCLYLCCHWVISDE